MAMAQGQMMAVVSTGGAGVAAQVGRSPAQSAQSRRRQGVWRHCDPHQAAQPRPSALRKPTI